MRLARLWRRESPRGWEAAILTETSVLRVVMGKLVGYSYLQLSRSLRQDRSIVVENLRSRISRICLRAKVNGVSFEV